LSDLPKRFKVSLVTQQTEKSGFLPFRWTNLFEIAFIPKMESIVSTDLEINFFCGY
jgi:hypothetical protein